MKEAQQTLAKKGLVTADRHGQLRAHPCCAVERDGRGQMLAAIKQLNLDIEPLQPRIGRPAGLPAKVRVVERAPWLQNAPACRVIAKKVTHSRSRCCCAAKSRNRASKTARRCSGWLILTNTRSWATR